MHISVIIPTYNRCETLLECLDALDHQTCDTASFDVVVVDDGSTDKTTERVSALTQRWEGRLRYVYQPNRGPAAARNRGVSISRGDLILFLGDDIIATPELVHHHMVCHHQNPEPTVAVLGKIEWSPMLDVTPLMRWMAESGDQFDYGSLEHQEPTYWHFYTSNISLKRTLFVRHDGFDEEFPYAACEDVELGVRLIQDGARIVYQPAALAFHDHPMTFESHRRRAVTVGIATYILERKHPGLISQPRQSWRSLVKRVVLALGPCIMLFSSDRMKLLLHRLECEQLFWQAFCRQAAHQGSEARAVLPQSAREP